jgi:cytochrome c oxidase subunit 2
MSAAKTHIAWLLSLCTAALPAGAADEERGRELFGPCVACHGALAEGNREVQAPALAGLPAWYVARQLENFRNGRRGGAAADAYGAQMARMAQQLWDDTEVRSVAAYVASLPPAAPVVTVRGKAKRGELAFASCAACHGADAAGTAELGAPPLQALDDWYLVNQLSAFRSGLRGSHPDDTGGLQMRAAAAGLTGDEVMFDLAAYVATLHTARESRRRN